jgi:catechol 2,3-dioxygenase-like lactoylglutathione lyase family enzyme
MIRVQGLDHITITVANVERSLRFYTETLGLERGPEWPGEITMVGAGGTWIAIAHWAAGATSMAQPPTTVDHFAFRVDAKTYSQARQLLGGIIDHESDHGICQSLYVKDPDGHLVELACYELRGAAEKMPR